MFYAMLCENGIIFNKGIFLGPKLSYLQTQNIVYFTYCTKFFMERSSSLKTTDSVRDICQIDLASV